MDEAKNAWWLANWQRIQTLENSKRTKIHALLERSIKDAERFLWNEVLRKEGLSMANGMSHHLVYVGGEGELDGLYTKAGKLKSNKNKYDTVVYKK